MKLKLLFAVALLNFYAFAQKSDFPNVDFSKADSIAFSHNGASLRNMPVLVHLLTKDLSTQVEQFRAIHTWVCFNIKSDHYFSESTLKKRRKLVNNKAAFSKWNTKVQHKVFKRMVRDKKTICSGYAYIIKALTNLADIDCEIVDGYGRNARANVGKVDFPNHSWNVVKLNGKWYFADATQASGYFNLDENMFVQDYNDGYFLAHPKLFAKNHYPIDERWLLLDNEQMSLINFVNAPIIYTDMYYYGIVPKMPNKLVSTCKIGETIVFQFDVLNDNHLQNVSLVLSNGFKFKNIKPTKRNYKNGVLELNYKFETAGQYDVHAKVGEDIIASFTIKIIKPSKGMLGNI